MSRESLFDVRRNELRHLEHADLLLAAEDRFEGWVGVDHCPLLGILKIVLLDVVPELFGHLATGQRFCADDHAEPLLRFDQHLASVSTGRAENGA